MPKDFRNVFKVDKVEECEFSQTQNSKNKENEPKLKVFVCSKKKNQAISKDNGMRRILKKTRNLVAKKKAITAETLGDKDYKTLKSYLG